MRSYPMQNGSGILDEEDAVGHRRFGSAYRGILEPTRTEFGSIGERPFPSDLHNSILPVLRLDPVRSATRKPSAIFAMAVDT